MNSTWAGYDPDVWLGATRDSDGNTWRFDQFSTSRTGKEPHAIINIRLVMLFIVNAITSLCLCCVSL